jgi:nucleoside-diphosphate-sugar epimerase
MEVLVTGAGGFIGRHLIKALHSAGFETRLFLGPDDRETGGGRSTFRGDIRDQSLISQALKDTYAVVHLAGPASVAASFTQPALYASVHVEGTAVVFDAARQRGVDRAVLVSSAEVYGKQERQPVSETAPPTPCSPYGAAKLGAETLAQVLFPGSLTIVRPFSVYGPGMRRESVLSRILGQVQTDASVEIETIRPIRDYIHVEDLARLISFCIETPDRPPPVLNACSGQGVSVGDLARLVLEISGKAGTVIERPSRDPRPSDILELVGDVRAALATGWPGARSLDVGLSQLIYRADRST